MSNLSLDDICLVTQMVKALRDLPAGELRGQRFRNVAYMTSDAWGGLACMPQYQYVEFDKMALYAEMLRRSLMLPNRARAA